MDRFLRKKKCARFKRRAFESELRSSREHASSCECPSGRQHLILTDFRRPISRLQGGCYGLPPRKASSWLCDKAQLRRSHWWLGNTFEVEDCVLSNNLAARLTTDAPFQSQRDSFHKLRAAFAVISHLRGQVLVCRLDILVLQTQRVVICMEKAYAERPINIRRKQATKVVTAAIAKGKSCVHTNHPRTHNVKVSLLSCDPQGVYSINGCKNPSGLTFPFFNRVVKAGSYYPYWGQ